MKTKREWRDNYELFEAVAEALGEQFHSRTEPADGGGAPGGWAVDEINNYGDRGTIVIKVDGKQFLLELHELT